MSHQVALAEVLARQHAGRLAVPEPMLAGGTLVPDLDAAAIEANFHVSRPGITQIDTLLDDNPLAALRRYGGAYPQRRVGIAFLCGTPGPAVR